MYAHPHVSGVACGANCGTQDEEDASSCPILLLLLLLCPSPSAQRHEEPHSMARISAGSPCSARPS